MSISNRAVADAIQAYLTAWGYAVTEVLFFEGHIQIMLDPDAPLPEEPLPRHVPAVMATEADEEQLLRTFGKTSDELADEAEKGYDTTKVRPKPHPEACDCIGGGKTCWYCIHGQHGECSADKHGDPTAKCPRQTSEVEK